MLPRHGRQAQSQSHLYPDHQGGGSGGQELSSSRHQAVPRLEDQVPSSSQGQVHGQTSSSLHHCASFYSRPLSVENCLCVRDIHGLQQLCFSFIDQLENGESFLQHSVAMCQESFGLVGNLRRHRAYSPRCFHLQEINI